MQWPRLQTFDGGGGAVDLPLSGSLPAGRATRDLGSATTWSLTGYGALTVQLLVNGSSRGAIPAAPATLAGGAISRGDLVQIRKTATPDGAGFFEVVGFDASGQQVAFGRFEAK